MNDINGKIQYNGKEYSLVFNLNVMEAIQEKYGTLDEWGELTGASGKEPNAKAVIFGFREMLNEGIDIENEENGTDIEFLTLKQVGRIITQVGLSNATSTMQETVINSTQNVEKNA